VRNAVRTLRAWPVLVACLALCGCGGSYDSTVTGMVSLDGAPLPRGTVKFLPDQSGPAAYGVIAADGKYSVTTGREAGLPAGAYTVTVVANEPSVPNTNSSLPPAPGKPLAPPWYRESATSGLKYTIESGSNEINIELNKTPPPGWKPPPRRR
jgi:hypothetical protein